MSSDVFIVSTARNPEPAAALQQALELASLHPAQIRDAVFGLDDPLSRPDLDSVLRSVGLTCPAARVSPSVRAIFFAAASILSDDAELSLAVALAEEATSAFALASPEAVGRLNLFPRARIGARSLAGQEAALRQAGLAATDVQVCKEGERGASLHELLNELEASAARWGLITAGDIALLIEQL